MPPRKALLRVWLLLVLSSTLVLTKQHNNSSLVNWDSPSKNGEVTADVRDCIDEKIIPLKKQGAELHQALNMPAAATLHNNFNFLRLFWKKKEGQEKSNVDTNSKFISKQNERDAGKGLYLSGHNYLKAIQGDPQVDGFADHKDADQDFKEPEFVLRDKGLKGKMKSGNANGEDVVNENEQEIAVLEGVDERIHNHVNQLTKRDKDSLTALNSTAPSSKGSSIQHKLTPEMLELIRKKEQEKQERRKKYFEMAEKLSIPPLFDWVAREVLVHPLPHLRFTDQMLLNQADQCPTEKPKVIFYNRVPKCGSTSMQIYIRQNARRCKSGYRIRQKNHKGWYCPQKYMRFVSVSYSRKNMGGHPQKNPYVSIPSRSERLYRASQMMNQTRAIFDTHTFFYDYLPYNTRTTASRQGDIAYFNVLRHPLDRLVSLYNYDCEKKKVSCNMTATEVFHMYHNNTEVRYLCGIQAECRSVDHISLYIAKVRLAFSYSLVGVLEQFEETTNMLTRIFPSFFKQEYDIGKQNKSTKKIKPKKLREDELKLFRETNSLDLELYSFAVTFFERKKRACKNQKLYPPIPLPDFHRRGYLHRFKNATATPALNK